MAIRLTPCGERHLPAFAEVLTDRDVERFTRLPVPTPPDFPRTWLSRYEVGRRDGTNEAERKLLRFELLISVDNEASKCVAASTPRRATSRSTGTSIYPAG
jgi:hypothetical protein